MTIKLNQKAFDHAKDLVRKGRTTKDERDDWSEHAPSADEENAYLDKHGWQEFGQWYLGVDTDLGEETKGHYKFPYGAESRAAQYNHDDIKKALEDLHKLLDGDHA